MSEFTFKKANQAIDVMFYQSRNSGDWYARVEIDGRRKYIGPASISAVLANVGNLIRGEAVYADARVHGVDNEVGS